MFPQRLSVYRVILLFACLLATCHVARPGHAAEDAASDSGAPPANWIELSDSEIRPALLAIVVETKANYERIQTWKGTYAVRLQQTLPASVVAEHFSAGLDEQHVSDLRQEFDILLGFAVDQTTNSRYWNKQTREMSFFRPDTDEAVTLSNASSPDGDYVMTAEHFLDCPSGVMSMLGLLPDHPAAQNKRVVFRRPMDRVRPREGDLLDPRSFFGTSDSLKFWEELDLYISALSGKQGDEEKARVQQILTAYQADESCGRWYRLEIVMNATDETRRQYFRTIWSPQVGHHPVRAVLSKDPLGKRPSWLTEWEWKQVDDVLVPSLYRQSHWPDDGDTQQVPTEAVLVECQVNPELDGDQFDYAGLGLTNGDLVIDKTEQIVYSLKDGRPTKLAKFHEEYSPSGSDVASTGFRWGFTILGALVLGVVLLSLRRRARNA